MLERLFHVRAAGSTTAREALGGLTTFLTMAYILFVNPAILAAAGVPRDGAVLATGLGAIVGTLLMAALANYPIALAPGMGLNAFFAFTVCGGAAVPWPSALGLCFWSGAIFVLLTITGARELLVRAVPPVIKLSAAVGIGLFIALIGLKDGGLVADHPQTLVTLGTLTAAAPQMALAGLAVTIVLMAARVRTAIFWGVAATALIGMARGRIPLPDHLVELPAASLPGLRIDLAGALQPEYAPLLLVLLFFSIFDAMGTLMAVGHEAGLLKDGQLPRGERAMLADAIATAAGSVLGTSTVTAYIESGAGVGVGARTGLANVVTALLFAATLFLMPLVTVVGGEIDGLRPVTAPALVMVGVLMTRAIREIDWDDMTEALPAFFTMVLMPLTFNISHGLAAGILVYVLAKAARRRARQVHWLIWVLAALFAARYAWLPLH
jgi:AGZA family xanthine/uracil permease-like MFS transporter